MVEIDSHRWSSNVGSYAFPFGIMYVLPGINIKSGIKTWNQKH